MKETIAMHRVEKKISDIFVFLIFHRITFENGKSFNHSNSDSWAQYIKYKFYRLCSWAQYIKYKFYRLCIACIKMTFDDPSLI